MTRGEARLLFDKWGRTNETCLSLQRDIDEKKTMIESLAGVKAYCMNGMPHGSGVSNPTEQAALRLEEAQRDFGQIVEEKTAQMKEALRFQKEIDELLQTFPQTVRWITELRYRNGYPFEIIAKRTRLDCCYCRQLDMRACDLLRNHFTDKELQKN